MFYDKGRDRDKHHQGEMETMWRFIDSFSEKPDYACIGY